MFLLFKAKGGTAELIEAVRDHEDAQITRGKAALVTKKCGTGLLISGGRIPPCCEEFLHGD